MLPEKAFRIIGEYTVNRPVYRNGNRFAVALPHAECSLQIDPAVQAVFLAQMLKGGNHIMCAVEMTGGTDADSDFYHFIIPTAFPKGKAPFPVHSGDLYGRSMLFASYAPPPLPRSLCPFAFFPAPPGTDCTGADKLKNFSRVAPLTGAAPLPPTGRLRFGIGNGRLPHPFPKTVHTVFDTPGQTAAIRSPGKLSAWNPITGPRFLSGHPCAAGVQQGKSGRSPDRHSL